MKIEDFSRALVLNLQTLFKPIFDPVAFVKYYYMEVSRLFWVGEVVLPALWLWHPETPAEIVFWINVHTYA